MLSLLFIRRPKTAAVISIALFLAGAICGFAASAQAELPAGYTQVASVKTDGAQWGLYVSAVIAFRLNYV